MATWSMTRNEIIKGAIRKLGVLAQGHEPEGWQIDNGVIALNNLIASMKKPFSISSYFGSFSTVSGTSGYDLTEGVSFPRSFMLNSATQLSAYDTDSWATVVDKVSTGTPSKVYIMPNGSFTHVKLISVPDNTYTISYIAEKEVAKLDASDEVGSFRADANNMLIYNLAVALAPEYGAETKLKDAYGRPTTISEMALITMNDFFASDSGKNSGDAGLKFSPSRR